MVKAAECLDFMPQERHAQAATFCHRSDVVSPIFRANLSFVYCDRAGDFIWCRRFPDLQSRSLNIGIAL